jgi:hypothetical protein
MTDDDLREHLNLLHSDLHQLFEQSQKHDEQIARLATIAEVCLDAIGKLERTAAQDGENIRRLARIAELHHERLTRLEEPNQ